MALAVPPGGPPPPPEPLFAVDPSSRTQLAVAYAPAVISRPRQPQPTLPPCLTVVVVNFCQWRNTARLTRQLRRSIAVRTGTAEVVVVDNHSPSDPVVRRVKRLAGVSVHRVGRNLGFAGAVNRACRLSPSAPSPDRWLLLLNPDVTVPDGFLDDILACVRDLPRLEPNAGVVGFRLCNRDGTRQASSGPFPTLWGTLAGLLRPRSRRKCRHRAEPGRQPVSWVTGGCLLVRRDCFAQLEGMDERFFLYYEDVDFCRRAEEAGWSVWYDPSVEVIHHWPLHARRVPAPLRLMTRHALLTYARKHWSRWQAGVLAGVVWLEAALRRAWSGSRGDVDSARCYSQLRLLAADVWRGREASAQLRLQTVADRLNAIAAEHDGRT